LAYALPGQEQRASKGDRPTARGTGAEAEGGQEVGGPHMSSDVADKSFMRLVGNCLHVGVFEGQVFTRPEEGTVQGSIIPPMLGNIYLHNVLDKWFEEQVKPRLKGRSELIRYGDDFIIGFERMDDAERVKGVLNAYLYTFCTNVSLNAGCMKLLFSNCILQNYAVQTG
jgi:hypothetical protein